MLLTEQFLFNEADKYILQLSGFPLDRVKELDDYFLLMEESLYMHVWSLAEPLRLEQEDFSESILPIVKLLEVNSQIDTQFADISKQARQTFCTMVAQYLWKSSYQAFIDIKQERCPIEISLNGRTFSALYEAKKRGLFKSSPLNE